MEEFGFRLKTEANLEALTEEVTKSSEIEGEVLSRDQVRSSLARRLGVDIGALTPAGRQRRSDKGRCRRLQHKLFVDGNRSGSLRQGARECLCRQRD